MVPPANERQLSGAAITLPKTGSAGERVVAVSSARTKAVEDIVGDDTEEARRASELQRGSESLAAGQEILIRDTP